MLRHPFGPRRNDLERDLSRELAYHVERRVADLIARGRSEAEARRQAALELGGITQARETVRDTWIWRGLDTFERDLRHAIRSLRRSWGFALGAGTVLALGIGANTAVFSVVHAVLLKPLPYPAGDRIVAVETLWTNTGRPSPEVSGPDFLAYQAEHTIFESLAHFDGEDEMATTVNGRGGFGNLRHVSADFFAVFGLPPAAGRLLGADDILRPPQGPSVLQTDQTAALMPAVVAHHWAVTNFGSAEEAVGKTFLLYRSPVRIVGVSAPGFHYPDATNIWIPAGPTNTTNRNAGDHVVGRLETGITVASAHAQLRVLAGSLAATYPDNRFKSVTLIPLLDRLTGSVQATLWMLMGAVALTLLIGCANIANLLLARAATRAREMALRSALGAGRGRLVRQLLTEGAVLASAAAAVGVFLAYVCLQGIVAFSPANLPRVDEIRMDARVLLFALGLSVASVFLFSLVPAVRTSRLNLVAALRLAPAKGSESGASRRLRSALVVVEVALSVMLLAGAGLLLRSFQKLNGEDLGFTTERVVTAYTQYALGEGRTRPIRTAFYTNLLRRVRALPGVVAASGVSVLPLGREQNAPADFFVEGRPAGQPGERPQAHSLSISTDFFKTLEIPLRLGRDFSDADTAETPRVVIVNESLARTAFPGESAVGRRIGPGPTGPWLEIVGVVGDTRWRDPGAPARPEYYNASGQGVGGSLTILARTSTDEGSVAPALRALLQEVDPTVPIRIDTMDEMFGSALAYPRLRTQLVGAFGAMALLLSAVGLFSVLAYVVGQRTRELAVRRAVGASPADAVRIVMGQGLRLVILGLAAGVAGALAGSRLLMGLLYETSPWDAVTYVSVVAALGLAATLAMILPALRAATVDPLIALRHE
jgi:putative ABC transport system permease protein